MGFSWNWSTPMNLMFLLLGGCFLRGLPDGEPDRHDDVVPVLRELVDVLRVVLGSVVSRNLTSTPSSRCARWNIPSTPTG